MRDFRIYFARHKAKKITQDFLVCRRKVFCKNGEKETVMEVLLYMLCNVAEEK